MGLIYLIRHGQTDWNLTERFRGRADVGLNENGVEQAKALATRLSATDFAAVYSSPLKRALKTAEIIAKPHDLTIQVEPGFLDVDYGKWQGLTLDEISGRFPELYQRWLDDPRNVTFPDGESISAVSRRALTALKKMAAAHQAQNIVVVAHQAINKILLFKLFESRPRFWEIPQDIAAINLLEFDGRNFKLDILNDVIHLQKV